MSELPKEPLEIELEPGREYWWCSCGQSKTAPWCDGSHQGTGQQPVAFKVSVHGKQAICQCGATQTPPFCDGAHERL